VPKAFLELLLFIDREFGAIKEETAVPGIEEVSQQQPDSGARK
jgi:hypothetical protein